MSDYWNHLLQTALLGTERQTPDRASLPVPLQIKPVSDKETHFLQTAALAWQYRQAGELVPEITGVLHNACEEETRPYASDQAHAVLRRLLDPEAGFHGLLAEWCRRCGARQWIVHPERLPALLEKGRDKAFSAYAPILKPVLGRRGVWLSAYNPVWQQADTGYMMQVWQEGKSGERRTALENLRRHDPALARTCLEGSWQTETPKNRADLLLVLASGLSLDDEPFLQRVYDECLAARQKKPDAAAEILLRTVHLLLDLPESVLSQYVWQAMKTVLPARPPVGAGASNMWQKWKKVLPGTAASSPAASLGTDHDVLKPGTLRGRFGWQINDAAFQPLQAVQAHLSCILPQKWTDFWQTDVESALVVFDKTHDCLEAVLEAVGKHGTADWAEAAMRLADNKRIQKQAVRNGFSKLLPWLSRETAERMYMQWSADAARPDEWRKALLARKGHVWSEPFTRHLFTEISTSGGSFRQLHWFFDQALLHMPLSLSADSLAECAKPAQPWVRNDWQRQVVDPLLHGLALRKEMEEAFA